MLKLLADTSALLALAMRDDRNHAAALGFVREHPHARFVLTEMIVGEFATRLRARADADRAAALARSFLESRRYEILFVDMDLLRAAVERMARLRDRRLSLTDCASFELMDRLGVTAAFTFDRDFRDCGYTMEPGAEV
jgi:predicted nucleic acid-binding protein